MSPETIPDPLDRDLAPGWIHQDAGDKVRGVVVDLSTYDGGFGVYPVVTIRLADGFTAKVAEKHGAEVGPGEELAIHCGPTVLRNEMAKAAPQLGNEIGVRRVLAPSALDDGTTRFKVVNYDRGAALEWSRFAGDDELPEGAMAGESAATRTPDRPVEKATQGLEDVGDEASL